MSRIKCPWCGSSAQVKPVTTHESEVKGHIYITQRYKCGCSCVFDRKFTLYDVSIVKVEKSVDKSTPMCYNTNTKKRKELK